MKKILYVFIFITGSFVSYAQTLSDVCYDPAWDWTLRENWVVYFPDNLQSDGTYQGVINWPFEDVSASRDMRIIAENNDLSPEDGWVLLRKALGCQEYAMYNPYVIFYNRYRGVVRLFYFNTSLDAATEGMLTLDWTTAKRSSALTYSNIYSLANDKYPAYDNDKAMLIAENYIRNKWWVAEFQVAFDDATNLEQYGYSLNFSIYSVINSDVRFTSQVNLITKTMEVKAPKSEKESTVAEKSREWAVSSQKAVQKLNYDEWKEYAKTAKESSWDALEWATKNWNKNNTHEWLVKASASTYFALNSNEFANILSKGVKGLSELNSALGFMVDFIDFFAGKPNKTSSPSQVQLAPLQITGTIDSEGLIKTNLLDDNFGLPLPGTDVPFPYYDCPLGVLNLKSTPTVDLRKWKDSTKRDYWLKKETIYTQEDWESTRYYCTQYYDFDMPLYDEEQIYLEKYNKNFKHEKWKSVRLNQNLEVSINGASNLELVSAEVALQGKVMAKSDTPTEAAYNLLEKYQLLPADIDNLKIFRPMTFIPTYIPSICNEADIGGNSLTPGQFITRSNYENNKQRWINKTVGMLKNKTYFLIEGGEELSDGSRNEFYKFRTEFVDIREARNLSFTVRDSTEITLKIKAVFKEVDNDDAPLMVFTNEYVIDEPLEETDTLDAPFPFIRNQLSSVEIYQGSNDFTLIQEASITTGVYSNGKIETSGNVNVNALNNVDFNANHSIELKAGFTAKASENSSFTARIKNGNDIINPNPVPLTQIAKYYKDGIAYDTPINCDCFLEFNEEERYEKQFNKSTNTEIILNASPIPVKDIMNIEYYTPNSGLSILSLLDINGTIIFQKNISSGYQTIDFSDILPGIYFLRVFDGKQIESQKIIK